MTVKTRAAISTEIATLFADNTSGNITPANLRTFANDITDSSEIDQTGLTPGAILIVGAGGNATWFTPVGGDVNFATTGAVTINNKTGYLFGCILSTAGGSSTFSITTGTACDANGGALMQLTGMSKTTGAWVAGTGNGALDTGAIANSTWYHVWVIAKSDLSVVDVLVSLSPTSPTQPAGYSFARRVGSMRTDGSAHWVQFTQFNDDFLWAAPTADISSAVLSTTPTLFALTTPTGVKTSARIRGFTLNATPNTLVLVSSPDETSGAANNPAGNLSAICQINGQAIAVGELRVLTNTSSQIRIVSTNASTTVVFATAGWTDTRGRLS